MKLLSNLTTCLALSTPRLGAGERTKGQPATSPREIHFPSAVPSIQTKSPDQSRGFSLQLTPETGFEPPTYALPIASDYQEAGWNEGPRLKEQNDLAHSIATKEYSTAGNYQDAEATSLGTVEKSAPGTPNATDEMVRPSAKCKRMLESTISTSSCQRTISMRTKSAPCRPHFSIWRQTSEFDLQNLKRDDTPPAVPRNLRILPIPERALKQGRVFIAQELRAKVTK